MSPLTRIAVLTIGSLALFQLAEYNVCTGLVLQSENWSRVGYIAITLLPAFGLHMTQIIAGKSADKWLGFAYGSVVMWLLIFGFSQQLFRGFECGGNYVIFQLKPFMGGMYFIWYYILLITTIILAIKYMDKRSNKIKRALKYLIIGYGLFIIPTSIANLIDPDTLSGIPSIMCGFAVLFAITIVFEIMPLGSKRNSKHKLD